MSWNLSVSFDLSQKQSFLHLGLADKSAGNMVEGQSAPGVLTLPAVFVCLPRQANGWAAYPWKHGIELRPTYAVRLTLGNGKRDWMRS
jgi:hypothetical protein